MKLTKRILCIVLSVVMLFSCVAIAANADEGKYRNSCPFIFVHGLNGWGSGEGIDGVLPYWGATTGNLMEYLRGEGYECYSCSVGPLNSAWDRACELYAQLTGTRVDYGEAHSAASNHQRYGRTYTEALVPDWSNEKQVHLIGHSFGGTTIRVLMQLLADGSEEERKVTAEEDISGLFTGGKADWVKSLTTICTPHNSSTIFYTLDAAHVIDLYLAFTYCYAALAGRTRLNGTYFDFHLEQFGLTDIPGQNSAGNYFKTLYNFLKQPNDSAQYDLEPQKCRELNDWMDIQDGVYYFSYAYSSTKSMGLLPLQLPIKTTNPVLGLPTALMGSMPTFTDSDIGMTYNAAEWRANDGLVNTASALYPLGEAHTQFDSSNIQPGIWNVMPVRPGDHGTAIGLLADAEVTHEFYDGITEMLNALPD